MKLVQLRLALLAAASYQRHQGLCFLLRPAARAGAVGAADSPFLVKHEKAAKKLGMAWDRKEVH